MVWNWNIIECWCLIKRKTVEWEWERLGRQWAIKLHMVYFMGILTYSHALTHVHDRMTRRVCLRLWKPISLRILRYFTCCYAMKMNLSGALAIEPWRKCIWSFGAKDQSYFLHPATEVALWNSEYIYQLPGKRIFHLDELEGRSVWITFEKCQRIFFSIIELFAHNFIRQKSKIGFGWVSIWID